MIILTIINVGVSTDATFGGCQPENQTCTECYHKLKESLLKRDINVRALSVAFFPPEENIPEFVIVTYCFNENCNKSRFWYWTQDSSYLFFPLQTFQYLSLFFGKPAALFSQKVTLVLDEICYEAKKDLLNLLTQRVSYVHVQITVAIGSRYYIYSMGAFMIPAVRPPLISVKKLAINRIALHLFYMYTSVLDSAHVHVDIV